MREWNVSIRREREVFSDSNWSNLNWDLSYIKGE
jgi:hypothetical protein